MAVVECSGTGRSSCSYSCLSVCLHYTTVQLQLHYFKLHYTRLHYTVPHYSTQHYSTLQYTTLITPHHNYNCNCNYTTLITHNIYTLQLQLDYTTLQLQLQLHYTTLHPAVEDEVTTATTATTPKNTTSTTFRSISGFALPSVIHNNSPIGFLFLKLPPPPCAVLLVIIIIVI